MKLWDFLKDKCLLLLCHAVCGTALAVFLTLTGYGRANICLILIFWLLILTIWLATNFYWRQAYFKETKRILDNLDQRYLLGELLPRSFRLEDRLYREMILRSNKSVIERLREMEDAQKDYKEYIESWVHEIKAPITSVSLLCENGRKKDALADLAAAREQLRRVDMENQKIENHVDLALYYARSENVHKDFFIQKTNLQDICQQALGKNKLLLIENQARAEVSCPDPVYTDGKWIEFILNQMILNSVKYRSDSPVLSFSTTKGEKSVILTLEDNGTGIRAEELSRIFEKGFTGSNGRNHQRATGMGLYLCQKLCGKLGIGLTAESEFGKGTKMLLEFPVSNYISRQ